mmetsp:Transcript_1330/g.2716  ORF Transcript_1330/g.2716 Transcript_1330/m.2716 type:complete len:209 (+) Transcript_1330:317-943(+)
MWERALVLLGGTGADRTSVHVLEEDHNGLQVCKGDVSVERDGGHIAPSRLREKKHRENILLELHRPVRSRGSAAHLGEEVDAVVEEGGELLDVVHGSELPLQRRPNRRSQSNLGDLYGHGGEAARLAELAGEGEVSDDKADGGASSQERASKSTLDRLEIERDIPPLGGTESLLSECNKKGCEISLSVVMHECLMQDLLTRHVRGRWE